MKFPVANDYYCFAACLQKIFFERVFVQMDQITIGEGLGISLPNSLRKEGLVAKYSDNPTEWGLNPTSSELQNFIDSRNLNLTVAYMSSLEFEDWQFEEILSKSSNSLICTLDYHRLNGFRKESPLGHAIIVERFIGIEGVEIYDPGPINSGLKIVKYEDVYFAAKRMKGGLWRFSKQGVENS